MTRNNPRAITLAEVLTVSVTCGLLAAIALPALDAARDQSHVAICLNNLRTIGQAAQGYVVENGTLVFAFKFGYQPDTAEGDPYWADFQMATEFVWGGGISDKSRLSWNAEWGCNPMSCEADIYCILESERPLNQYLSPGVWWCDPERRGMSNPIRRQRAMQLPDFFKCPSDCTPSVPSAGATDPPAGDLPDGQDSTWEWWGTSYAINWWWGYYFSHLPLIGSEYGSGALDALHQYMLTEKTQRGASEWVLFMENRCNYAIEAAAPRGCPPVEDPRALQGWHGQQDMHAAAYFDGSARYRRMDTRYVDGPGWTLWPNRPWTDTIWEEYQDN